MDKDALSAWVEEECAEGLSYRQLALSLGVSPHAISSWRDKKSKSLAPESLQAIALRRKESVADTAKWLDVEAPQVFDLPGRFNELEQRMVALEKRIDAIARMELPQPTRTDAQRHAVLDEHLLSCGVDVRRRRDQERILAYVAELPESRPGLFERMLVIIVGVLSPSQDADIKAIAGLMKMLTGQPWTPSAVVEAIEQARVD